MIRIITVPSQVLVHLPSHGRFMVLHPKHMFLEGYLTLFTIFILHMTWWRRRREPLLVGSPKRHLFKENYRFGNQLFFQLYANVRQWTWVGFQIRTISTQSKRNVLQTSDSSVAAAKQACCQWLREARTQPPLLLMFVWQKGTIRPDTTSPWPLTNSIFALFSSFTSLLVFSFKRLCCL